MSRSTQFRLFIAGVGILLLVFFATWWNTRRDLSVPLSPEHFDRVGDDSLYPPPESPGAVDNRTTQNNIHETICLPGYTSKVRPPATYTNRIKRDMMLKYLLTGRLSDYELDHIIPLELGGCPDCESNLWVEPLTFPGAHEKDRAENYLHREVCSDRIPLEQAQRMISEDWYAVYLRLNR